MSTTPSRTLVHELARPIHLGTGRDAVLLLHGWTGWAGRLGYVAQRLADSGFTVEVPRLPGHGTSLQDFLATDAGDWYRRAVDSYLDLRSVHDNVFVAGTSMGPARGAFRNTARGTSRSSIGCQSRGSGSCAAHPAVRTQGPE